MASRTGLRARGSTAAAVVLCCCAVLWFTATAAQAHAQLLRSNPTAGSVVALAPAVVTLTFGEEVQAVDTSIDVYDDHFVAVDVGPPARAPGDPTTVGAALPQRLARGTYTVSWRVSSGDTHPVAGSFRFSVGAPSRVSGTLPGAGRNEGVGVFLGLLRWTGFLGAALGPGAVVGALVVWPEGLARRQLRVMVVGGLGLLLLSTAGGMLLQGVYASGQPLSALWRAPQSLDSHSRRFDQVYAVRSYLLVVASVGVAALLGLPAPVRDRWRRVAVVLAAVATTALLATWPVVGHSAVPPGTGLALVSNLVHIGAMVLWLGGLCVVVVATAVDRKGLSRNQIRRFSSIALVSVALLVASGVVLAWREVGSVAAVTGTTFGRVLLAKSAVVVALLAVANLARRHVARLPADGDDGTVGPDGPGAHGGGTAPTASTGLTASAGLTASTGRRRGFLRGLLVEVVLAGVVLALTAALVSIVPGRQSPAGAPSSTGGGSQSVAPVSAP